MFDLGEADRLLAAAAERDLFFAINFNHRYARPVEMARDAIASGALGQITFATWRFGGEVGTSTHAYANLIETQCHGFDMLEHLCGPIAAVSAHMNDPIGHGLTTLAVALTFASGAVGALAGTYDSSYAYPDTHYVEVNGTAGRVQVVDTVKRFTRSISGSETREVWEAGYFNDPDRDFHHLFERHLDALIPAFRAGEEPPIHARAGRRALELAVACIRSFEESRQVPLAGAAARLTGGGSARPPGEWYGSSVLGLGTATSAVASITVPATPSRVPWVEGSARRVRRTVRRCRDANTKHVADQLWRARRDAERCPAGRCGWAG